MIEFTGLGETRERIEKFGAEDLNRLSMRGVPANFIIDRADGFEKRTFWNKTADDDLDMVCRCPRIALTRDDLSRDLADRNKFCLVPTKWIVDLKLTKHATDYRLSIG